MKSKNGRCNVNEIDETVIITEECKSLTYESFSNYMNAPEEGEQDD